MKPSSGDTIYQLYVELVDSHPPIWRCFQVPANLTLAHFHTVLQAVMGWSGEYSYFFKINGQRYGQQLTEGIESGSGDASAIALVDIFFPEPELCFYTYDPSEGWLHLIELDEVPASPNQIVPCCTDGERACPPEKSGGVWGYEEFLERLSDPDDPDYDALWQQAGQSFDPAKFDLKGVNQRLAALNLSPPS